MSKIVFENGKEFYGVNFGCDKEIIGEVIFNTSMVGYQEILSDPAYFDKIVCMSYPIIGSYGLADDDYDPKNIRVKGYIVKEYNDMPSNFRSTRVFGEALEDNGVVGISDVDTRAIVRMIRNEGIMKAMICDDAKAKEECLAEINHYEVKTNPVKAVSCKKNWYSRTTNPIATILVLDCGVKTSLIKELSEDGFNVIVCPYNTSKEQILRQKADGVIISNGPGNPNDNPEVISLVRELKGKLPILGLGLGAEIVAVASGAEVKKLQHGHYGVNLPVRNILNDKIEISSQNNGYAIIRESLEKTTLKITHEQVIDKEVAGFMDEDNKIIGVEFNPQYNKETDEYVIKRFLKMTKRGE